MNLVSVVIPTIRRPLLLLRALRSVLAQTHPDIEVIVVIDGPDSETVAALQGVDDPRVQVIQNARSMSAAGARNAGIDRAAGDWLAFLDDDDAWLPEKLVKQLAFAANRPAALITCLSRVVTHTGSFVRPETAYDNVVPLADYLFDRRSPFGPPGFVQTSGYLVRRTSIGEIRFRTDTPHDDWDFLLRLATSTGLRVETVPEILVTLHLDHGKPSLSAAGDWADSLAWIESVRPLVTRRAYSGFCLGVAGARAAQNQDVRGLVLLLGRALWRGSARPWQVAAFVASWIFRRRSLQRLPGAFRRLAAARVDLPRL